MSTWSLAQLLAGLHENIEHRIEIARKTLGHAGTKGDGSENVWLELFQTYLPTRYHAEKAHVVDSRDKFSQQIDVVIFDRQYSPFIFDHAGQKVIPAESVYAVFEAKQSINVEVIRYSQKKIGSVRSLYRTSLPIPHAGGTYTPKSLNPIIGGIVTFQSDWNPLLGTALTDALAAADVAGKLDIGCVAAHGMFSCDESGCYALAPQGRPATAFLFERIARLQTLATVPMIDVRAYARWLAD
jgi:hypothetical protein